MREIIAEVDGPALSASLGRYYHPIRSNLLKIERFGLPESARWRDEFVGVGLALREFRNAVAHGRVDVNTARLINADLTGLVERARVSKREREVRVAVERPLRATTSGKRTPTAVETEFLLERTASLDTAVKELQNRFQAITPDELERSRVRLRQLEHELEASVADVKKAAEEVGLARHSRDFGAHAAENLKGSYWWLGGFVTFMSVAFAVGYLALENLISLGDRLALQSFNSTSPTPGTVAQALIPLGVGRLIIVSVFITLGIWCAGNYRIRRHNYELNKHRQIALNTVEALGRAAGTDADLKKEIFRKATEAIFNPSETGYLRGK